MLGCNHAIMRCVLCAGLERESGDSDSKPAHSRRVWTNSASCDSGLTMSNEQLYDDTASPVDDQWNLELNQSIDLSDLYQDVDRMVRTGNGKNVAAATQTERSTGTRRKSTIISDDSVLGSPEEFSTETSEHDWDDVVQRRQQLSVGGAPIRLRSAGSESASRGLASAFYAQRPKSFDADTEEELTLERVVTQPESKNDSGGRRNLERKSRVEELTPVNSWRRKQSMADRDDDLFQDRIQGSPLFGYVSSSPGRATTGLDVYLASGRRSVDAIPGRKVVESSSYEEALLHKELLRNDLSDADRQQIKNNLARKLYHKSLVMYASQKGQLSKSPSQTPPPRVTSTSEPQSRSSPISAVIPRRNLAAANEVAPRSSAKLRTSPQVDQYSRPSAGNLTVTVSPANWDRHVVCEPVRTSAADGSPLAEGRRRFHRKHLTVVDISSSSSDHSFSNCRHGALRRRIIRRRASDRYKHRCSEPKIDCSNVAGLSQNKGVNLGRSRSDASDVVARISRFEEDRAMPRANESLSLLVTGSPHDRRVIVNSSDAMSMSSDSTFTGGNETKVNRRRAYTMKDRQWHRELVAQYGEPGSQHSGRPNVSTSRYHHSRQQDASRRATTVVILPPALRSRENTTSPSGRANTPEPHKPSNTTRVVPTTSYVSAKQDRRPQGSDYPRTAVGNAGRRRGSSEKLLPRAPHPLVSSVLAEGRSGGRQPSTAVGVDYPNPRSLAHKPRPAIQSRRPPDAVSDLPSINWSVKKLRERYSGGVPANQTSAVAIAKVDATKVDPTKVDPTKVDKTASKQSRIGAVQRLL